MAINVINQVSPGIVINELDLTQSTVLPGSPTIGAFVGEFSWGPVHKPTLVSSSGQLNTLFRSPTNNLAVSDIGSSYFTCSNFLGYSSSLLYVVREASDDSRNSYGLTGIYTTLKQGKTSSNAAILGATTEENIITLSYNTFTANVIPEMLVYKNPYNNILTRTEKFDVSPWDKGRTTVVPNTTATSAPDLSSNSDLVLATSVLGTHFIERSQGPSQTNILPTEGYILNNGVVTGYPLDSTKPICYSVYLKPSGGISNVRMELTNSLKTSIGFKADFKLTGSGVQGNTYSYGTTRNYANNSSITSVGNDWYRCSVTATVGSDSANNGFHKFTVLAANNSSYTPWIGNGTTQGLYIWGAQAEQAISGTSGPTDYTGNDTTAKLSPEILLGTVLDATNDSSNVSILLQDFLPVAVSAGERISFKSVAYTSDLNIKNIDDFNSKGVFNNDAYAKYGPFVAKYPGKMGDSIKVSVCSSASKFGIWKDPVTDYDYSTLFDEAPGTSMYVQDRIYSDTSDEIYGQDDELHIVVVDSKGLFTGSPGTILEKFVALSKGSDVIGPNGRNYYYVDYINEYSNYIYASDFIDPQNTELTWGKKIDQVVNFAGTDNYYASFNGGYDSTTDISKIINGWDAIKSSENYDYDLVLTGGYSSNTTLMNHIFDNVVNPRKDCVMFISPKSGDVIDNDGFESDAILQYVSDLGISSSYVFMDNNWKYQYDPKMKIYRWVPLNGDIAGLCSRTDKNQDPWYSPAGYNRGKIMNVTKLGWNADKTNRDLLYRKGVNPVIYQTGEGTLLFGDKMLYNKVSAFDRINVRRLFLTLEKTISRAAKLQMFEMNDSYTRARFVSIVEPFLREVQGRRGIYDFRVVCDESNNTDYVIDTNGFIADIYIKPARSINFIQLNFIASKSGVDFNTLVL
jgi:hypothetical protein